jgi:hypothetical protein
MGTNAGTGAKECQSATTAPKFPTGYGPNLVSLLVEQCTLANCAECNDSKDGCTKCDVANKWFLGTKSGSDQCQKAGEPTAGFPEGFGPNLSNNKVEACTMTGCKTCDDSIATCTACLTSSGWYMGVDMTGAPQCQHATNTPVFPSGYGPNTDGLTVGMCVKANCDKCPSKVSTCTACITGYFIKTDEGVCYNEDTFPTEYGGVPTNTPPDVKQCLVPSCDKCAGSTLLEIDACTVNGCISCVSDYSTCLACKASWYFDKTNTLCYETLPSKMGLVKGTTVSEIKPCEVANCEKCNTDNTVCDECVIQAPKLYLDGNTCTDTIPDGKGVDTSIAVPTIKPCTDTVNCLKCADNINVCTECASTIYVYVGTCVASITGNKGKDTAASVLTLKDCKDTKCATCSDNYEVCTQCNPSVYLDGTTCTSIIPAGKGVVTSAAVLSIAACQDSTNCAICEADNTICTDCKNNMYVDGTVCVSTIADGKGLDLSIPARTLKACTDTTNCAKCAADYTKCSECSNSLFVKADDGTCVASAAKYGKDLAAAVLTIKPCTDTNCDVCTDNYKICTECPVATALLIPDQGKCYLLTDTAPTGYGKKVVTGSPTTLVQCVDTKCSNCFNSYDTCTKCIDGYVFDDTNKCIPQQNRDPVATIDPFPMFEDAPNTFGFVLRGKKITKNILSYFFAILKNSNGVIFDDQTKFTFNIIPSGVSTTINIDTDYSRAILVVERVDKRVKSTSGRILAAQLTPEEQATLDSMPFPFQGNVMANYKGSSMDSIKSFEVYTKIGVALRIATNVLLPFDSSSRVAAFGIDRMFSHFTLAAIQGSKSYVLSRMALRLIQVNRRAVIPFLNLDPNRENDDCVQTTSMLIAREHCDFTVNYGDNAMGLGIILGFMIIIDIVFLLTYSQLSNSQYKTFSFLVYMALKTFGVRFFLAKMEAVTMEVVYHFFINVFTLKSSTIGGFILGIIMTLYLLSQLLICLWYTRKLSKFVENSANFGSSDEDIVSLFEIKETDRSLLWKIFSIMWVGMRAQIGKHSVYYPVVSMVRMFLLGLLVGLMTEQLVAMGIIVIIIEVLFLAYLIFFTKFRPRISILDNCFELIGPVFNIIYYFFSIISTANSLNQDKGYDTYLYIIILVFMLANLSLAVASLLLGAWRLLNWMKNGNTSGRAEARYVDNGISNKNQTYTSPGAFDYKPEAEYKESEGKLEIKDAEDEIGIESPYKIDL